ncbi:unnamed protein product [Heligmosomoides polygyrus]|uniref:Tubulin polymerization-promoting protein family member 2 n=1 Tax=Heligmosomoides polygyrus TaxID=6339 RepID=A0A183FIM1_HELPZ|nr:unnamed protein product [Heligmosomoides polygyrus]
MTSLSAVDTERHALRILLLNRKGDVSIDDIKTDYGCYYEKFVDAANAKVFWEAPNSNGRQLSVVFSCLLCYCAVSNAAALLDEFSEATAEDFAHRGLNRD